jgi:hypothetical protein
VGFVDTSSIQGAVVTCRLHMALFPTNVIRSRQDVNAAVVAAKGQSASDS